MKSRTLNEGSPCYHDWLTLSFRLLWVYDHLLRRHADSEAHGEALESGLYHNNGGWLVRSGWAEVIHNGHKIRAYPGQWLIVKPTTRLQRFARDTRLLSIAFEAKWPDGTPWLGEGLSVILDGAKFPELEHQARKIASTVKRKLGTCHWDLRSVEIDSGSFLALQGHLAFWLGLLVGALATVDVHPTRLSRTDERLVKALRKIEALPLNDRVSWQRLSAECGCSLVHLNRLFQEQMGLTMRGYFDRIRSERAALHLEAGARPKQVAHELGFVSLSHFSRWFHQRVGMSPRAFAEGHESADVR